MRRRGEARVRQRGVRARSACITHAPYDVGVLQLLQEGNLADGSRRNALVLRLQPNLLERNHLARDAVLRLVHHAVSPFADLSCRVGRAAEGQGSTADGTTGMRTRRQQENRSATHRRRARAARRARHHRRRTGHRRTPAARNAAPPSAAGRAMLPPLVGYPRVYLPSQAWRTSPCAHPCLSGVARPPFVSCRRGACRAARPHRGEGQGRQSKGRGC